MICWRLSLLIMANQQQSRPGFLNTRKPLNEVEATCAVMRRYTGTCTPCTLSLR